MVVYHYNPTSNRNKKRGVYYTDEVVYHYNPTSNRNSIFVALNLRLVVYHYNPTSNRNEWIATIHGTELYIIIILHQTAT